jgi:hypothetical protein
LDAGYWMTKSSNRPRDDHRQNRTGEPGGAAPFVALHSYRVAGNVKPHFKDGAAAKEGRPFLSFVDI